MENICSFDEFVGLTCLSKEIKRDLQGRLKKSGISLEPIRITQIKDGWGCYCSNDPRPIIAEWAAKNNVECEYCFNDENGIETKMGHF